MLYPAIFTYETGREIAVMFPDFDVATSGVDDRDAFLAACECLGTVIRGYEEDGKSLPVPTALSDVHIGENERTALIVG